MPKKRTKFKLLVTLVADGAALEAWDVPVAGVVPHVDLTALTKLVSKIDDYIVDELVLRKELER